MNMKDSKILYCATDTPYILVLKLHNNNSIEVIQELENETNPDNLKHGAPFGIATEWITLHPDNNINNANNVIYAITSFWATRNAIIVTYKINNETGCLERIGSTGTGGLQCCVADFSPSGRYLALAHYIDGKISIFDTYANDSRVLESPIHVIELPGERNNEDLGTLKYSGPAAHGLTFSNNGKHFVICDAGTDSLLVYSLDASNTNTTRCTLVCRVSNHSSYSIKGWLQSVVQWKMMHGKSRPRHAAFHPNGRWLYVLHEMTSSITLFTFNQDSGELAPVTDFPETSSLSVQFSSTWWRGIAINAASEIIVSSNGEYLFASNRGLGLSAIGSYENSVTMFRVSADDGSLTPLTAVETRTVPRHFLVHSQDRDNTAILAGLQGTKSVGIYTINNHSFSLSAASVSEVGQPVTCLALWDPK